MSKVLLFSDIHIHKHKKSESRLADCLKCLQWVFDEAKERNIKNILFGGDFFHDRERIDIYSFYHTYETLRKNLDGNINLWLLFGNHDIFYYEKTTVNSITPLGSLPGVKLVDQPERIKIENHNWDFIPFTHDPVKTLQELQSKAGTPEYALGHIALNGALMHFNHYSDAIVEHEGEVIKVDKKLFSVYKDVFLGHFHGNQIIDNIEYIGSPLQLSFGEMNQQKHLIVFDTETRKKEYVINNFSPTHEEVYYTDANSVKDLNNCFAKIYVEDVSKIDMLNIKQTLPQSVLEANLRVIPKKAQEEINLIEDAKTIIKDKKNMLEKYVKENNVEKLDEEMLLKIGNKICSMQSTT